MAEANGGRGECRVSLPTPGVIELAVERLRSLYPDDPIGWRGGGRALAEQALAAARWAAYAAWGGSCRERVLAAAAALFREIIALHPLVDGNKRLAVVILASFLLVNGLPTPAPGSMYEPALRAAGGVWGQEEVYEWLLGLSRGRVEG